MKKVDRNAPCPCGSGKKYKQCCIKQDEAIATSKRAGMAAMPNLLQAALMHYQAGRFGEAEVLYQQVLQINPHHPDALHLLGAIAFQTGRFDQALELIGASLSNHPNFAEALNTKGLVLQAINQLDEAVVNYQYALSLKPDFVEAHNNLGNALKDQGKFDSAIQHYEKALLLHPQYALAHSNLGFLFRLQNKLDQAAEHCATAISIHPDFAEAHNNLGGVYHQQGKLDDAAEHYQRAIALRQNFTEAHSNLGVTLQAQGKLDEAENHYQKALVINPNYVEGHNNLALVFQEQGKLDQAVQQYHQALSLNPDYAEAYNNLGNTLKDQGRLDEAIKCYQRALSIKPNYAEAHNNIGDFRQALSLKRDYAEAHSNLLFALNFDAGQSQDAVYLAAQKYESIFGLPLRSSWPVHANDKNPNRRLRVGYVSPDFRNHAVAYFAEPIFSNHDKTQVEVYCYAEVMREDEVTARFRGLSDHWHSTVGMNDEALAQMIRQHQIDILIDLAGHTAKNRLLTFARKPAPIQITYLGYPGTTGLSAMDYRLTDRHADPENLADAYYSEHLLRLPGSLWCYRPSADMPEISPLPALARGYITFGSFNNFNKIDQPTLNLWAELLRAVPGSRLMMITVPEGDARARLQRSFAELGIDLNRLEFHGKLPCVEFHRKFLEVDITLDPVTVNGATTTCESVWMGVPVMSLTGERFLTRAGLSILSTIGFNDFAVGSREDFIHLAKHLADNLPLLAELRAGLRDHLRASPLIDEVGFTHNLENLYREVWGRWCGAT